MPRQPRFQSLPPAGIYHVTARGVARQSIAADDADRRRFVSLLDGASRKHNWELLAYCLMPNHFHLVVASTVEALSRGMHSVEFRYAQRFNERHDRAGHLFQGRFFARSIEGDESFARVCTYVFENPVRAELCARRDAWQWSGGALFENYADA